MKKRYYYKHRYFYKRQKTKDNISIENEILENRNDISYENIEVINTNINKKSFSKRFENLKIKYKKDPKKFIVIATSFLLTLCLLVGGSFATLSYLSKTENTTKIESGTLALEIKNESNSIMLEKAIPQEDNDALENNNEYLFTVENTGTIPSNYQITLDNTCSIDRTYILNDKEITPDKCIPNEYIKVGLKEGNNEYQVLEYDKEKEKYILDTGTLNPSEIKEYKMKVWLDYDTPNDYNSQNIYNIIYSGKLGIDYNQVLDQYYGNTYTIVYNANGGEGTMESSTISYGEEHTLLSNSFKRFGYAFKGWSTNKESTEIDYEPNEKIENLTSKNNEIVTLYAVWEKILTYQVRYNSNGGTGTIENSWHEEGILKQLSKNTFVKEHYNFIGWSLEENGEVVYQDEEEVIDLTTEDESVVDLYAVWQLKNYKINVVVNNGTLNDDALKSIPYNTNTTFNITANTGYSGPTVSCTNNQTAIIEGNTLTIESISNDTTCTVTYRENPTVSVTVTNGIINGNSIKSPDYNTDVTFNLIPNSSDLVGVVECTNNQEGTLENNILTVSNVTSDTICTVKYLLSRTVLYSDGTFIINEVPTDIKSNITLHGEATIEYEAFSETNSYVFTSAESQPWVNERESVINVEIGQKISPVNTKYWFYNCENMETGDFTNLGTSEVTSMAQMFADSGSNSSIFSLTGLDDWDVSNVTDMSSMFYDAGKNAEELYFDLSSWDVSSVTDMNAMFRTTGRNALEWNIGNLTSWDVSNVQDMTNMFVNAATNTENWSIGDLSSWNVSNAKKTINMFCGVGSKSLVWDIGDLSNWDVSSVIDMNGMFNSAGRNATEWNIGDLSSWDVSDVTDMNSMFMATGRNALEWNIGDLSSWDVSSVQNMTNMFVNAATNTENWNIGDLSSWDVSNVKKTINMFCGVGSKSLVWDIGDLSNWDVSSVIDMNGMFNSAGRNATEWNIGDLSSWDVSDVTDMNSMFMAAGRNATEWNIGDLSSWDVSNVQNMTNMFINAGANTENWSIGDISSWDVSSVTNMTNMFLGAGEKSLVWDIGDLSNWDVSNVTSMSAMFCDAGRNAEELYFDLSSWDVSEVTNMASMFESAGFNSSKFYIGDLSSWDVSKVTNMYRMFNNACYNSKKFNIGDIKNWDVSQVTNMSFMFNGLGYNAEEWSIGNLSLWNTSKVTNMNHMFGSAGSNAVNFENIGILNIPESCDVSNMVSSKSFVGDFKINGSLINYLYISNANMGMLSGSASNENARINLYYTNDEAETVVDELIAMYGPNGTVSQGNIYKVDN